MFTVPELRISYYRTAAVCSSGNRAHIERFHLVVNLEFNKEFPT